MKQTRSSLLLLAAAALAAAALVAPAPALADGAVLASDGTVYEVFPARYADVVSRAVGAFEADLPVLALRTTRSGQIPTLEILDGTIDENVESSVSVALEESTATLFVAYAKERGFMADMHVAIRRGDAWSEHDIASNRGFYLSINPRVVVTRQQYVVFDDAGAPVTKTRSIFSLVWWEESGPMQARYAPIFVEDGALRVDSVQPWNLNELDGIAGATDPRGLPLSAFTSPSVQPDPTTNGGVLATFANLVTGEQQVLRITFPDDLTKLVPPGTKTIPDEVMARAHVPIGRTAGRGRIPETMDTGAEIGATISQKGVTTFHWVADGAMNFVRSDDPAGAAPRAITLRSDLSAEKALRLVTTFAEKN